MINGQPLINAYLDLMKKALTASIYDESAWERIENRRPKESQRRSPLRLFTDILKYLLVRVFNTKSIVLMKKNAFNAQKREEGRDWPFFGFTMIGHKRLENIQICFEDILRSNVPGDFIETGAWRGGATIYMRALLKAYGVTDRKVWVADSFEGLPVPLKKDDGWDLSQVDYLKVSLEEVKSNFKKFDLLDEQVVFLKGWFCDTLPSAQIKNIAILRLDGDMYNSTMDALRNLYHRVSRGGYIIVDDYYSWPACRRAVTDFLHEHSIKAKINAIDRDGAYWKCE